MVSKRKIYFLLIITVLLVFFCYRNLLHYGLMQLQGQLHIIKNSKEISEVLQDTAFPDSLKHKLQLIQQVKQFSENELGLKPTSNYETVFDQKGKAILWVVTAAEKYELKEYSWSFPFLGKLSYKGFFDYEKAEKEQSRLQSLDYDTGLREVTAWSTLGWFKDPVLTNFLNKPDVQLINLIIHELTHSTLYLPDSVTFNENFANFVAHKGTLLFLEKHQPESLSNYLAFYHDDSVYTNTVLQIATKLEQVYADIANLDVAEKENIKKETISKGIEKLRNAPFINKDKYTFKHLEQNLPNNTFFLGFIRYDSKQKEMKDIYLNCGEDIKQFIACIKDLTSF